MHKEYTLDRDEGSVLHVLYVNFQDSGRPEIPKQYFSFADVSVTAFHHISLTMNTLLLAVKNIC